MRQASESWVVARPMGSRPASLVLAMVVAMAYPALASAMKRMPMR
jgi:hypothetical protein